jgi:hypothetical protein
MDLEGQNIEVPLWRWWFCQGRPYCHPGVTVPAQTYPCYFQIHICLLPDKMAGKDHVNFLT